MHRLSVCDDALAKETVTIDSIAAISRNSISCSMSVSAAFVHLGNEAIHLEAILDRLLVCDQNHLGK